MMITATIIFFVGIGGGDYESCLNKRAKNLKLNHSDAFHFYKWTRVPPPQSLCRVKVSTSYQHSLLEADLMTVYGNIFRGFHLYRHLILHEKKSHKKALILGRVLALGYALKRLRKEPYAKRYFHVRLDNDIKFVKQHLSTLDSRDRLLLGRILFLLENEDVAGVNHEALGKIWPYIWTEDKSKACLRH